MAEWEGTALLRQGWAEEPSEVQFLLLPPSLESWPSGKAPVLKTGDVSRRTRGFDSLTLLQLLSRWPSGSGGGLQSRYSRVQIPPSSPGFRGQVTQQVGQAVEALGRTGPFQPLPDPQGISSTGGVLPSQGRARVSTRRRSGA